VSKNSAGKESYAMIGFDIFILFIASTTAMTWSVLLPKPTSWSEATGIIKKTDKLNRI
jgi:hypothetical protein